mgnify:CR=1 FL=1
MNERSGIICAGNWIVDLVHDIDYWPDESNLARISAQSRGIGGGPANVISALARLQTGILLWPIGAVGRDDYGNFILQECRSLGLPTEHIKTKSKTATAHTHVMSVAGRSRTFFYQGGANDVISDKDFPFSTFKKSSAKIFYLGYLTLLGKLDTFDKQNITGAAKVLKRAKTAGITTCVDLVSMPHPNFQSIVAASTPYIDFLIINEIEAAQATGSILKNSDPDKLVYMAQDLLNMGVSKAVVIHCVERIAWVDNNGLKHVFEIEPLPIEQIVSNLGAGDAFCAGLLYGLHQAWAPERCIWLAKATAKASLKGHTATESIPPLKELTRNDQ